MSQSHPGLVGYTIHPAALSDIPAIVSVFQAAFADDHLMSCCYHNTPKDVLIANDTKTFTRSMNEGDLYGERLTKVVQNDTDETVGFSIWQFPHYLTPEQKVEKEKGKRERRADGDILGARMGLLKEFFGQLEEGRKKWVDPEKMFLLQMLAIHPNHQRKGLGSRLIRLGLEEADRLGARTYIEASPAGLPVYLRYGWRPVEEKLLDLRPYGCEGIEHHLFLMREPSAL